MSGDFAERFGYKTPRTDLEETEMPDSLRNGLWDVFLQTIFSSTHNKYSSGFDGSFRHICIIIWTEWFMLSRDNIPAHPSTAMEFIKSKFFSMKFFEVYGFTEFLAERASSGYGISKRCNLILERERSAFRFADNTLVKISDEDEVSEIESAMKSLSKSVATHVKRAAELYSQTPTPDYRNCVKEAISAVEAAVRFVTEKKTIGVSKPLKAVADEFHFHPALREGFEKLYAFTSDSEGIRHALMEESVISQHDARYMLISCSAFANYLVALKSVALT